MTATVAPASSTRALDALLPLLACPHCRAGLTSRGQELECSACRRRYQVVGNMPVLLDEESAAEIAAARGVAENVQLRQRLGGLQRLADLVRPPHPFLFLGGRANRRRFSTLVGERQSGVVLDIGSGLLVNRNASGLSPSVRGRVIPLEIAPSGGIGVVGDAHKLPWRDASLDGVLIQGVLEHVRDPIRIVSEIQRALKPGAPVYAEVPFLQHYHLDPLDFRRYTVYGFEQLFGAFERADSGVMAGPASALTDMLTEFPALLFKPPALYWGVKLVTGWLMSPIQLLDFVWARLPRAHIAAGGVYFLGRKAGQ